MKFPSVSITHQHESNNRLLLASTIFNRKMTKLQKPVINLRPATLDDLALLQHWDEQPHVVASDPNDDDCCIYRLLHTDWSQTESDSPSQL
jgi:hypothetical protein